MNNNEPYSPGMAAFGWTILAALAYFFSAVFFGVTIILATGNETVGTLIAVFIGIICAWACIAKGFSRAYAAGKNGN